MCFFRIKFYTQKTSGGIAVMKKFKYDIIFIDISYISGLVLDIY